MSGVWRAVKPCGRPALSGPAFADTSHLQSVSVPPGFDAPADAYSQIRQIALGTDRRCQRVEPALCCWTEMLRSWFKPVRAVDTSQLESRRALIRRPDPRGLLGSRTAYRWEGHRALVRYVGQVLEPAFVETDSRGRVVLPGHPNQRYLVRENADGSILLQPATVMTEAQHEVESTPELRDLLARAAAAPTVNRARQRRS